MSTPQPPTDDLPAAMHLTPPGSGPVIAVVGDVYRFLATGAETGGRYALWEAIVPPGGGPPLHMHTRESEAFLVVEGDLTFHVDDRRLVAGPGNFVHLEPGTRHSFRNETDKTARTLIQIVPAGLEKMFMEVGIELKSSADPLPRPDPEEIARFLDAAPRYGITLYPPEAH